MHDINRKTFICILQFRLIRLLNYQGAVNLLPAPLTTTQIYGTAGRRHSMYMPAPSEYGGFYSEQQHAAIYGFAGFPPAPPPLPYYSMAGPPMDYEAFKRTMKAVHKQEEMAAAKQKLDDGASDDLSFSCVRLCCGDEAKVCCQKLAKKFIWEVNHLDIVGNSCHSLFWISDSITGCSIPLLMVSTSIKRLKRMKTKNWWENQIITIFYQNIFLW